MVAEGELERRHGRLPNREIFPEGQRPNREDLPFYRTLLQALFSQEMDVMDGIVWTERYARWLFGSYEVRGALSRNLIIGWDTALHQC